MVRRIDTLERMRGVLTARWGLLDERMRGAVIPTSGQVNLEEGKVMRASASDTANCCVGCADAPLEQDSEVEAHAYEVGGGKLWKTRQYRVSAM
jgi:hypothetical protein